MIPASISRIQQQANEAFLSGQTVADCPYPLGSSARTEWIGAFAFAHFEMEAQ